MPDYCALWINDKVVSVIWEVKTSGHETRSFKVHISTGNTNKRSSISFEAGAYWALHNIRLQTEIWIADNWIL